MMNTNQSEIHESIYESKTHKLSMEEPKKVPAKGIVNENEKPFIHYYEENIKLKRKQDDMAKEILKLKNQVSEQQNMQRENRERELKMLATGAKSVWDNKNSRAKNTGYNLTRKTMASTNKNPDSKKV